MCHCLKTLYPKLVCPSCLYCTAIQVWCTELASFTQHQLRGGWPCRGSYGSKGFLWSLLTMVGIPRSGQIVDNSIQFHFTFSVRGWKLWGSSQEISLSRLACGSDHDRTNQGSSLLKNGTLGFTAASHSSQASLFLVTTRWVNFSFTQRDDGFSNELHWVWPKMGLLMQRWGKKKKKSF